MHTMYETIKEYHRSCEPLRGRIAELSDRISGRQELGPGESVKLLTQRRYLLYCELAQLEQSIALMLDYLGDAPPAVSLSLAWLERESG